MRLIDANERKQQLENPYTEYPIMIQIRKVLKDFIDDAPTIDPVKHAQWIKMSDADGVYWACSECGEDIPRVAHYNPQFDLFPRLESIDRTNYCPNCGAKMDGAGKIGYWVDHVKDFWCSECGCRILPEQVDSFSKCPQCKIKMVKK